MDEVKQIKLRRVPIVPIRGSVVFPNTDAVLTFGRKKSVDAVNNAYEPYLIGMVEEIPEESPLSDEVKAVSNKLVELFKKAINLGKQAEIMTVMNLVSGQPEPYQVADQIASLLDVKTSEKQKILEILHMT